jgi:hypothetical protein
MCYIYVCVFRSFSDFAYVGACVSEGGCTAEVSDIKLFARSSVDKTHIQ